MKRHLQNPRSPYPSIPGQRPHVPAVRLLATSLSAALMILLGSSSASAVIFTGSNPGNVQTLTESSPLSGIYLFSEDYLWRDEEPPSGAPHPETLLGSWASRTVAYDAGQWDGIGNVVMLENAPQFIEYAFLIPVDSVNLVSLSINTVMRGASARSYAYDYQTGSWPEDWFPLTRGGSGFDSESNTIGSASWDTSVPGQVSFRILIEQINGSAAGQGIDSLMLTATTVPEPNTMALLAIGLSGCAWAVGRRRR